MSRWYLQHLDRDFHDVEAFDCGIPELNEFLCSSPASEAQEASADDMRIYVVVASPNSQEILAYVSFIPDPFEVSAGSDRARDYGFILLNVLAVDKKYQRQGIGRWVLADAFIKIVEAAETSPLDGLLLQPYDEKASKYYQHLGLGFVLLPSGDLFLPVETMNKL